MSDTYTTTIEAAAAHATRHTTIHPDDRPHPSEYHDDEPCPERHDDDGED